MLVRQSYAQKGHQLKGEKRCPPGKGRHQRTGKQMKRENRKISRGKCGLRKCEEMDGEL